ncbi:MAG: hypothetical protein JOY64_19955 [Alphaproteobacteria bacterium]|nr:hypothetical protein [Alphaproteobacteria bacterium]MBV8409912.1 hypothetical protein [Alphaproteobacteria bacterium]
MLVRLSLLALAAIGMASVADATTITRPPVNMPPIVDKGMPPSGPHKVAFTDEYGFRYDKWGNRLDARGHVIGPPHTLPGALVIQN